jgi:hypothetical protein
MEKEKQYGCVYFFRHVGLEPVKIGYSSNNNPIKRFNQFKTYAPYGAEILGFIQSDDAKELETLLHKKYALKRLDGEWFNLTVSEVNDIINLYTAKEQIKDRNNFQIEYAKFLENKKKVKEELPKKEELKLEKGNLTITDLIKENYEKNPNFNRLKLAEDLGVSRQHVHRVIRKMNKN